MFVSVMERLSLFWSAFGFFLISMGLISDRLPCALRLWMFAKEEVIIFPYRIYSKGVCSNSRKEVWTPPLSSLYHPNNTFFISYIKICYSNFAAANLCMSGFHSSGFDSARVCRFKVSVTLNQASLYSSGCYSWAQQGSRLNFAQEKMST